MPQNYRLIDKEGFQYYTFPIIEGTNQVICAFTTRLGGNSQEPYDSLNMAYHVGDETEKVRENRRGFLASLGIDAEKIVAADQVHGDVIKEVTSTDMGRGAMEYDTTIPATDALITNIPQVPLLTCYADCVPLFFYDPVKKVVALSHAGWKGTVLQIGRQTVERMVNKYGCEPFNVRAGIAPSIGPCCYEVDEKVMERVKASFPYWQELTEEKGTGKWKLNLWEANRRQLLDSGLKEENIAVAGVCTNCNSDHLFSYRAAGGKTGRMAAIIMLR